MPEAQMDCKRAGFLRDQEDNAELRPDSATREGEVEAVDFEDLIAIDDPRAIFCSALAEGGMSVEASSTGDDAEEESDNEMEMYRWLAAYEEAVEAPGLDQWLKDVKRLSECRADCMDIAFMRTYDMHGKRKPCIMGVRSC
ncbi:hypothetical protein TTRE_0000669301 [Trichuris trichiura]|uniref:Uncharacterized protein n=1 Tax=Trichuris trichiura TaxID=36087 RepID=A0A077ZFP7_TRITR|nr:hypothetical protein TTRE_0000669301 [Trichuris trichiura]